jgi:hypothetical protein
MTLMAMSTPIDFAEPATPLPKIKSFTVDITLVECGIGED